MGVFGWCNSGEVRQLIGERKWKQMCVDDVMYLEKNLSLSWQRHKGFDSTPCTHGEFENIKVLSAGCT